MTAPVRQWAALNTPRSSDCSSFSHESTSSATNVGWYRSINRNSTAGVRLDTITGRGTRPLSRVAAVVLPHSGAFDDTRSIGMRWESVDRMRRASPECARVGLRFGHDHMAPDERRGLVEQRRPVDGLGRRLVVGKY